MKVAKGPDNYNGQLGKGTGNPVDLLTRRFSFTLRSRNPTTLERWAELFRDIAPLDIPIKNS